MKNAFDQSKYSGIGESLEISNFNSQFYFASSFVDAKY